MAASRIQRIFLIYKSVLIVPMSMCSNISHFVDLLIYSHTKKHYQGYSNINRDPFNLY